MSKIITRDELAGGYRNWAAPAMGGAMNKSISVLTAKQIEQIQRQAYDEGFAQGRGEGLASAQPPLEAILNAFAEPLSDLDDQVLNELSMVVMAVARQLIRRELKTGPDEIVAVVRESLSALPAAARHVRVHLHPEDAVLVRSALALGEGERHWQILDDPVLTRGGCRVFAEASQIDASVESRLAAAIAAMLGGERENDNSGR